MEGHQVRCAKDGVSALNIAEEFHPEAVLLDIGLPHMDGYEVIQRLRAQTHTHQVVVLRSPGTVRPRIESEPRKPGSTTI